MSRPLIIGAGPAGIRAAQTLVRHGLTPVVVDEAPACGGQIYRQPLVDDGRTPAARYGSEAGKATALHRSFAALQGAIDYRPGTLVWALAQGRAQLLRDDQHDEEIAYDGLILATGAMDRIAPLPGWTLPGVFSLGGAQIALKAQGMAIGNRVVFLGSGPLLYLVAWQYLKAGVTVAGVLDLAPVSAKRHLLAALPLAPGLVLRGVRMVADLMRAGVPVHQGIEAPRIFGGSAVTGVVFRPGGRERTLDCDGVGTATGLKPETQLADLAGCAFSWSDRDGQHLPVRDAAGRSSVPGVVLAGDGGGIMGADAAELAGERAALALLADRGHAVDAARCAELETALARQDRLRTHLARAFAPAGRLQIADDTLLCRCEEVTAGQARAAITAFDVCEINRLKALCRVGMGRCQGRICAPAAAELLAEATGTAPEAAGRLRAQAPIKPISLPLPASGGDAP